MSYGLMVWNASGTLTLDTTVRVVNYHSQHSFNIARRTSLVISVPGYVNDGTWGYYVSSLSEVTITVSTGSITLFNNNFNFNKSGILVVIRR